ncbi:MAG: RAMP superfamily CRISPR-associated protein [Thermofilaceae archaeon]|nr:RAMP superfamily CRISPR-associated protein [Thermofilaceae archaeon]MDW8004932.1 RAMP superfamily CRISPR-associated protein [Thermofilaceae archaeon]
MPTYADFDKINLLTVIEGCLINETPLRIGVGRESYLGSAVDIGPLKIRISGRDVPYIPGSSLKGSFRSLAESLARAQGLYVHDPWDFETAEDEKEKNDYCIICGIFGSTGLASHVRIYDAYPRRDPLLFIKTGVSIDRDFRGARPGALFIEQQVIPKIEWYFRMDVINIKLFPEPEEDRGKLLRQVLDLLVNGIVQVGARKTVGYGLLRLTDGVYKVYEIKEGRLKQTRTEAIKGGSQ